jgi:hypothetical protein
MGGKPRLKTKELWQLHLDTLMTLVKEDQVAALATRVDYPLRRDNLIPGIDDANDF